MVSEVHYIFTQVNHNALVLAGLSHTCPCDILGADFMDLCVQLLHSPYFLWFEHASTPAKFEGVLNCLVRNRWTEASQVGLGHWQVVQTPWWLPMSYVKKDHPLIRDHWMGPIFGGIQQCKFKRFPPKNELFGLVIFHDPLRNDPKNWICHCFVSSGSSERDDCTENSLWTFDFPFLNSSVTC